MRTDNIAFESANLSESKTPRFVVEISFDTANTDLYYFTSHGDTATPTGANVVPNVIRDVSVTSQKLDPLNARATIGTITFKLLDVNSTITTLINTKLDSGFGLRQKRVRVYVGDLDLEWADFQLVQTQIVETISFERDGIYNFKCSDIQRQARKDIFDTQKTSLSSTLPAPAVNALAVTVDASVTTFVVLSTLGFPTTGKFICDFEICSYNGTTATDFQNVVRGQLGTTATAHNGDPNGDAGVIQVHDITVANSSTFELLEHGTSYTDGPNLTVGYFKIDEEICRYHSKASATEFNDVVRGVLNTQAVAHEVDPGITDPDRKPKIEEYVYLEMPLLKLAPALLTGDLNQQPGKTLPTKWHLGIDTTFVKTSAFLAFPESYDQTDDNTGFIVRFEGVTRQDGKAFLEKELYALFGGYSPVLSDGQLSVKKMTGVISKSAYVATLDHSNVISYGTLMHDQINVHNQIEINWNWNELQGKLTRTNILIDADSIATHGEATILVRNFRGLHGSRHTTTIVSNKFNALRDRYSGPPLKISITCLHRMNYLEIGDVVRVQLDNVRDYSNNVISLDRPFEVQSMVVNWVDGSVQLGLFGSSQKAGAVSYTAGAAFLDNAYYTVGTDLSTVTTNYMSGGVLHITAGTLTGDPDITNAVYYYGGDVEFDAGSVVTISENVDLRIKGNIQVNGLIDGKGKGLAGATVPADGYEYNNGLPGYVGVTESAGVIEDSRRADWLRSIKGITIEAFTGETAAPPLELINYGNALGNIPPDLRGTSGSSGGSFLKWSSYGREGFTPASEVLALGGDGGDGGAGLVITHRGISFGINGEIDLSGDNGQSGISASHEMFWWEGVNHFSNTFNMSSGSGAGGAPGACYILADGTTHTIGTINVTTNQGATFVNGEPVAVQHLNNLTAARHLDPASFYYPHFIGTGDTNLIRDTLKFDFVPDNKVIEVDIPEKSQRPIVLVAAELSNTPQTVGQNLSSIEVTVTPPDDTTYSHSNIYAKLTTQDTYVLAGSAQSEVTFLAAMDGSTYDIRAKSVSIFGIESDDFIDTQFTVSTQAGYVDMTDGNHIAAGQTAYDTGVGFFLERTPTGGRASFGDSAGDKVLIENGNVSITGSITADTGFIGGWKITATSIENTSGRIKLDNANDRIRVQNVAGTNHVTIDDAGITGVDSVLGTTFILPTNGAAPTFASGVINSTIYNISTSGILRTSTTVGDGTASSNGVLINNTGIKVFESNSSTPSFHADASDGSTTLGDDTSTKFVKWDTTDLILGRDSELQGGDSYNNDTIYLVEQFTSIDVAALVQTGTATVALNTGGYINLTSGTGAGDVANYDRNFFFPITDRTWNKNRRFKTKVAVIDTTATGLFQARVGTGRSVTNGIFFFFDGLTLKGQTYGSGTQSLVTLQTYTSGTTFTLEAIFTTGSDVEFFVNSVSKGSITTNLPTGTTDSHNFIRLRNETTAAAAVASNIRLSEFKLIQEN